MWQRTIRVVKYSELNRTSTKESIAMERVRRITWDNGDVELVASPQSERELAIGYMIVENRLIWKPVEVTVDNDRVYLHGPGHPLGLVSGPIHDITPELIYQLTARFSESAILYKDTGATFSAAFAGGPVIAWHAEDVNQRSAVYKAVGKWCESPLLGSIMLISSTIDLWMVQTAFRLGVRCLITRGSATDKAIDFAGENSLVVIGYARGLRFTVLASADSMKNL